MKKCSKTFQGTNRNREARNSLPVGRGGCQLDGTLKVKDNL